MFEVIGIITVAAITIVALIALFNVSINYNNNNDSFMLTFFEFGIIIARSPMMKKRLNTLCQTTDKTVFINAPMWFNLHVYNFGVKKD